MALKVESERLDEIPVPFIAHSKRSGGQFLLVNNINGTVEYIDEGGKKKQSSREEFSKEWDSVVLLAEKQEASGETNYAKQRKENCFLLCVLHLLSPATEHVGCWSTTSSLETCRSSIPISCVVAENVLPPMAVHGRWKM